MRAWKFQDHRQKEKLGAKAPWTVGWIDPEGRRKSKRIGSKSNATKFARKIEGQMAAGTYENVRRKSWKEFRKEYDEKITPGHAPRTKRVVASTLNHFERICKPAGVMGINTQTIDDYINTRRTERGKKPKSKVSPATINREIRHLKAAIRVAHDWGYLSKVPKFRKEKEQDRIGQVITPDDFKLIYEACDNATMPRGLNCDPGEWWQALLVFAITTGWRIDEILSFRRDDLDLETGAIMTRAADNKASRDDVDYLPDEALSHVKRILGFNPLIFHWPHNERTLWVEFQRIQKAAGIHLPCPDADSHECNDACHFYGFHSLRRGYATLNADSMAGPVLQKKMRHKSFTTTLKYIGLSDKMKKATEKVYVPSFLVEKKKAN